MHAVAIFPYGAPSCALVQLLAMVHRCTTEQDDPLGSRAIDMSMRAHAFSMFYTYVRTLQLQISIIFKSSLQHAARQQSLQFPPAHRALAMHRCLGLLPSQAGGETARGQQGRAGQDTGWGEEAGGLQGWPGRDTGWGETAGGQQGRSGHDTGWGETAGGLQGRAGQDTGWGEAAGGLQPEGREHSMRV